MSGSSKLAVIGLGSTLRRDDGIGIVLLEALREKRSADGIDFLNYGTASFGLVNVVRRYDKALILDAVDAGWDPGTLKIFKASEAAFAFQEKKISSHELSLADLLALLQDYGGGVELTIAGIQVQDVSLAEGLCPRLQEKMADYLAAVESFIQDWKD